MTYAYEDEDGVVFGVDDNETVGMIVWENQKNYPEGRYIKSEYGPDLDTLIRLIENEGFSIDNNRTDAPFDVVKYLVMRATDRSLTFITIAENKNLNMICYSITNAGDEDIDPNDNEIGAVYDLAFTHERYGLPIGNIFTNIMVNIFGVQPCEWTEDVEIGDVIAALHESVHKFYDGLESSEDYEEDLE